MQRNPRGCRWGRAALALATLAAACSSPHEVQEPARPERVDVEWIWNPEREDVGELPQAFWRGDGKAILLDPRRTGLLRTFELFDPETGAHARMVEPASALASLRSWLEAKAPETLEWPLAFDAQGEQALYLYSGDVFVLDLARSTFRRITETEEEEKSPSFSPDGTRVAYVRGNDLRVAEIANRMEQRLTTTGSETLLNGTLSWVYWEEIFGRRDIGYWWSPDSQRIAFLETDESGVDEVVFTDFEPAAPRVIRQRYPKAGSQNPVVRAGVVPVADAPQTTWMQLDPASYEYLVRVKWLPDSQRLALQAMTRDQRRLDLYFASADTGALRPVLRETNEAWVNFNDDLYFLADGKRFVWASERSGYAHLYLYGLDGAFVRPITRGGWALASSGGVFWMRQGVAAIDERGDWIYFTALQKSSIERHLYRVHLDGTGLERVSQADGTHEISFSPDARYYFDRFSDVETPPSLDLYQADGRLVSNVCPARLDLLSGLEIAPPELFTIPADDGFPMPAQIQKPASFDRRKRYPLVLYVYGGPSAPTVANAWTDDRYWAQVLVDAGYLVASVDNRSATGISKQLENQVALQSNGDSELNDLVAATRWFKRQRWVDPERVGIWGWSGGGSITLLCMTRSEEFKAGIAVAAVTDWRYYDTKWAEFTMKTPAENPEGYAHTSLAARAKDLHGRLLLVHGTYDDNVHPQNAWRFVDELVKAGKPFDLMMYPMRKHGISDPPARRHLYNTMLEFWKRNL